MANETVTCAICNATTSLETAVEANWYPCVRLRDGSETDHNLCPACGARYLEDVDGEMSLTSDGERKIAGTLLP